MIEKNQKTEVVCDHFIYSLTLSATRNLEKKGWIWLYNPT